MKDFCIIGSGISGATIANILSKKYSLDVYDKARGAGGRSSNKKFNKEESFDHGVQYISPKSVSFKRFINNLITKKIVKKWQGKHIFLNTNKVENKKHLKIIGNKGNNSISKYLLKNISCTFNSELIKISNKDKVWELDFYDGTKKFYKSLILTCPFPQLKKLSKKYIKHSFIKQKVKMDANITVMLVTKKTRPNISSYFFSDQTLGWAAYENSKKRFKSDYDLWTLQSTYKWANKVINKNKVNKLDNAKILINKFFELTNLKKNKIFHIQNHGWKYSSNPKPLSIKSYWDNTTRLGVCADWFVGSRLESGWLSAKDLSLKIKK
ncbi:NAD(P)/FAD-dependent oxidoreductase [Candidatus Pelagibacter sp. Uisw_090]|uniref:NAD(P)/FAD-dependent oxidoreductase n=1 Tax=Candidatus Pelagibacter sp. Uisw_090 TaxID=3230993 RepID=UPI0039E9C629